MLGEPLEGTFADTLGTQALGNTVCVGGCVCVSVGVCGCGCVDGWVC